MLLVHKYICKNDDLYGNDRILDGEVIDEMYRTKYR